MKTGFVSLEEAKNIHTEISEISSLLEKPPVYGLRYISFEDEFPLDICNELKKLDLIPVITWEFFFPTLDGDNRRDCNIYETHIDELLSGKYDSYLEDFANNVKLWGNKIYLRPLHEFNAHWYVWSGSKNGGLEGGPDKIKRSWIYIVNKFRSLKVDNVKWIWCAHETSDFIPLGEWNKLENYWPGDKYVDLLGLDGFNFYPENPERNNPKFHDFDSLFADIYNEITSLSNKPIMIMTGSSEFSYNGNISCKSDWIDDAFDKINKTYKQIEIVGWFHFRFNERIDWRINSSKESIDAFNRYLK